MTPMRILAAVVTLLATSAAMADEPAALPAFPGAEGFGAVATGGRGGRILHVTNLNPDGPGSLQWACREKGPRIVVFDVGGVIRPGQGSKEGRWITILHGDITIAGQTAPPPGITIDGMLSTYRSDRGSSDPAEVKGHYKSEVRTENVIVRFLRIRPTEGTGNLRVAEFYYCKRAILDHVSGSWGLDQSFNPGYPAGDDNFTFQWCAMEESDPAHMEHSGEDHGFGFMGSWHNSHVSIHHNLLAHHVGRAPLLADHHTEFSNNVLYNVGPQETQMGSCKDAPNRQQYQLIGNYWKTGPGGLVAGYAFIPPLACSLQGLEPRDQYEYYHNDVKIWFDGNYFAWDGYVGRERIKRPKEVADAPFDFPPVTRQPAEEAYEQVLAQVGCLPRDAVSKRTLAEVRTGGGCWGRWGPDGGLLEGLPEPGKVACPPDADQDGMPDAWEKAHGLNPADPADASKVVPAGASPGDRHKGYTYVEYYFNDLADQRVAEAVTAARLDREAATKPWDKPANGLSTNTTHWHKSLDDMVAAVKRQDATQKDAHDPRTYNDLISAWQAIIQLNRLGDKAAPAVAELAKGLAKGMEDPQAVTFSAWALGAIGPVAKPALPDLLKALQAEQSTVTKGWSFQPYGYIAWALGRIGLTPEQARQAAPALGGLLVGRDTRATDNAAWALSTLGKDAEPALAPLLKSLGKGGYTGHFAARSLGNIGAPAFAGLVKALSDRESDVRANAARALGWAGPAAADAAAPLADRLAKDAELVVRAAAATAIGCIAPQSQAALVAALSDKEYNVRVAAAEALGNCGPAAKGAADALVKLLADPRGEVRRAAVQALGRLGEAAALATALSADDAQVRGWSARALGDMGNAAAAAVPALVKAAADGDPQVRREAVLSLALLGPSAAGARDALSKACQDEDYVVRTAAAAALERIGK
ncbi:MAG: hypothetical protein BIFFINMI_01075 [Phycisphaerae bacterium]|nr:hypothetical protein [Phycisphaerae bacterium]